MLVLKYEKKEALRFVSHRDLLKHFSRIFRRACIDVDFSKGFNPHMLLYFTPPISLGLASCSEYVSMPVLNVEKDDFLELYNKNCPKGLMGFKIFEVEKDPKLQAKVVAADFVLPIDFDSVKIEDEFFVTYDKKGETVTEEVRSLIFNVFERDGKLGLCLAYGMKTLRVDRVAKALKEKFGVECEMSKVEKINQYVEVDGKLENVDSFLEKKQILDGQK